MSDTILLHIEAGLARVTFNRPASLNAMDLEMGARWRDVARQVTSDPAVGAVILDAAGPAFCAGGDVVAMSSAVSGSDEIAQMAHVIHEGIRTFVESDKPIVAAVQGAVAGGGLGLMLAADYIVASDRAKFVSKYANIGLTPDLGVSTLLPAAIGQRRALQLLLQDTTIDAATALEWGLVAEVVGADAVASRAAEIAAFWLDGATAAFGQAKRLVRTGAHRPFSTNLDDEAATIGAAFGTDAARARIAAFAAASRKTAATKENS
ncbi:enoyl-CoA hydratase/isomerase family protein [Microbacterium fluvii]|uniref:Enoyl-CoA hydratase/isomerase family protein n=1 Tax=Microbacterium fluvii TaxID=415215 RepID=A0ABW2HFT9_9MICO|nr:enoyl-CoA hydratase/isomerase family protein [Microbacterium fluvii]MCU4672934.1 enoyl-CoA hydratase/isomerase family protein [Microbacterium fluvii]